MSQNSTKQMIVKGKASSETILRDQETHIEAANQTGLAASILRAAAMWNIHEFKLYLVGGVKNWTAYCDSRSININTAKSCLRRGEQIAALAFGARPLEGYSTLLQKKEINAFFEMENRARIAAREDGRLLLSGFEEEIEIDDDMTQEFTEILNAKTAAKKGKAADDATTDKTNLAHYAKLTAWSAEKVFTLEELDSQSRYEALFYLRLSYWFIINIGVDSSKYRAMTYEQARSLVSKYKNHPAKILEHFAYALDIKSTEL